MMYFVYITVPTAEEAEKIGRTLVEEKLAGCINILPQMTSIYCWEGNITKDNEVVMLAKTLENKISELETRIQELHSYDIPCIAAIKIDQCSKDFEQWLHVAVNR